MHLALCLFHLLSRFTEEPSGANHPEVRRLHPLNARQCHLIGGAVHLTVLPETSPGLCLPQLILFYFTAEHLQTAVVHSPSVLRRGCPLDDSWLLAHFGTQNEMGET